MKFSKPSATFSGADLRKRLLFALGLLAVYRLGGHIPTRGSIRIGWKTFSVRTRYLFGFSICSAAGRSPADIFALASCVHYGIDHFAVVDRRCSHARKAAKEGELGRRKITSGPLFDVILALIQSFGIAEALQSAQQGFVTNRLRIRSDDHAQLDTGTRSSCGWVSRLPTRHRNECR